MRIPVHIVAPVLALLAATIALPSAMPGAAAQDAGQSQLGLSALLAVTVFGLAFTEQLFRGTQPQARWAIKPLCLALGGAFVFDLYMYAEGMLLRHIEPEVWAARALVQTATIPLIGLSATRNKDWALDISLSRGVVLRSTAILACALYLLTVAAAGYSVRFFGSDWGRTFQIGFLFVALLLLVYLFASGTLRAKLRVLVNKHFFAYRYDYREEWLRFTRLLSTAESMSDIYERCIKALADLVESPAGVLWLIGKDHCLTQVGRWNMPENYNREADSGSLMTFLRESGWVVDLEEQAAHSQRYPELQLPAWLATLPHAWLMIPLACGDDIIGFAVLSRPRVKVDVNWEVRDLLKAASKQAATFLQQVRVSDALLEAQKFDAFNRMSAFVVHDLKNLVAQLSLMLKNAERHSASPEFQKDMLGTIEHVVARMTKLLQQLRAGTEPVDNARLIDLSSIVTRVKRVKSTQEPHIEIECSPGILALGHEDRLQRVFEHLVQNAIDASSAPGKVRVSVYEEDRYAVVEVSDHGVGMTADFIRNELLKPFRSTKSTGMGIGAYESSHYVNQLGGQLAVESEPGAGTRIRVMLPRVDRADAPSAKGRRAA